MGRECGGWEMFLGGRKAETRDGARLRWRRRSRSLGDLSFKRRVGWRGDGDGDGDGGNGMGWSTGSYVLDQTRDYYLYDYMDAL